MDVSAESPIVAFILDGECLVSPLIQMAGSPVPFGVPIGVTAEPVLHAASEIRLRRPDQSVDVVWHPAVSDDLPTASVNLLD